MSTQAAPPAIRRTRGETRLLGIATLYHPRLAVGEVLDREVGRVAAVAERHRVGAQRLGAVEQPVHRDAAEARPELRPAGDAVDVAWDLLELELVELVPGPLGLLGDHAVDPEGPLGRVDIGRRAGRQDREPGLVVLARGKSVAAAAAGAR